MYLFFILALTFIFYHFLKRYAEKVDLIDIPNGRSSHTEATIRGFGVVLFISIYITLFIFNYSFATENFFLLSAIFLVMMLGLLDDIKGSKPIIKIATLIMAYVLLYLDGYLINDLGVFLGIEFKLYHVIAILFTLFSIVAFTNAFNLIDGLDGLSGLISIVIFSSFLLIGYTHNDQLLVILPILFICSIIVFLFFNWHPAEVFLGDSGSLMIGFVISVLGIKSLDYIEPIVILYIAAVPILDSLIVFGRRVSGGLSPFSSDKSHLHHILLHCFKGDVVRTVITIAAVQAIFSTVGLMLVADTDDSFIALIIFIVVSTGLYKLLTVRYLIQQGGL